MRNYLTFGGKDSRDFGVYISGQGTFSAPEKAYTFYSVPGRNGAIIGNERRLENIEVSYECFIYADFDKNIGEFRSFLLSCIGYQELSDSYHPDEFRLACYTGPFEPEVTRKNDAGSFTLTFNCKPQRYLKSGQSLYSWYANSGQNVTGDSVAVKNTVFLNRSVLSSHYEGGKDLNHKGYLRSFRLFVNGEAVRDVALLTGEDGLTKANIDWAGGTATALSHLVIVTARRYQGFTWAKAGEKTFQLTRTGHLPFNSIEWQVKGVYYDTVFDGDPTFDSTSQAWTFITKEDYATAADLLQMLQEVFGTSATSDHSDLIIRLSMSISSPPVRTFDPYVIQTSGSAVFSSEYGVPITIQYANSDGVSNPTFFASEPLVRVYGNGSFEMDGVTVTVTNSIEYCDIDCELMDCYEGSTNRNADVTFSTYDFPKLQPGDTAITILSGITKIEVRPRWWMV